MKHLVTTALVGLFLLPGAAHGPAAAAPVPVAAAPAPAAEWSVTPAGDDDRVSLRHTVDPGASVSDAIVVTNLGSSDARFAVTVGDGVVGPDGAFDIRSDEPSGGGSWLSVGGLEEGGVALAAGEARELPVRIDVPADATPGDHPAGIVVGVSARDGDSTVTTRIGVRVHLRVAGEVQPQLAVRDVTVGFAPSWIPFAPGRLSVEYTLANEGNVRLGGAAEVWAAGPFGLAAAQATEQAGELLPGEEVRRTVQADAAPLALLFGGLEVTPLVVGADELAPPASVIHEYWSPAVSWTGLALLVLLGGVAVLLVRRRRAG
ncbi:hypothetical protein FVA74_00660 [Salinibacterium sp. dk2585]|uniref:hypothetical protein n=1 Tax=unclassified Salinibacterium TaxID=2632331 RepID=UPI0011C24A4C|nr:MULTISPECIES: hypothetical protein [unclassified Salinibacterium]QEE60237.1 hypothetical protein FVA74_00660 [Salinibacterium sp. dk2585]TXK55309.1 hypothetical protein FVP63_00805 [Salinibacterium sp. dk5596]